MRYALLLAGGHGERFWPKSRLREPKQFLRLEGDQSLLQATARRLEGLIPRRRVYVVSLASQTRRIHQELPFLKASQIIGEPVGKNTAAAIALGTSRILKKDPDAVVSVFPCDQWIGERPLFRRSLREANRLARKGKSIVLFGVKPDRPETGYGYFEAERGGRVNRFIEKPSLSRARQLLRSKTVFWNSGMFVFKGSLLPEALRKTQPRLSAFFLRRNRFSLKRFYASLPPVSFDKGVLERFSKIESVTARFGWEDVGSWLSLDRRLPPDRRGNRTTGTAFAFEAKRNLVVSDPTHLVVLFGVSDLAVIHTKEATLVCPKERLSQLKRLVGKLKQNRRLRSYL